MEEPRQPLDPARQSFCDGVELFCRRTLRGLPRPIDPHFGRPALPFRYGACIGGSLWGGPVFCCATNSERSQDGPFSPTLEPTSKNSLKGLAHETRIPGTHACFRCPPRSSTCGRTDAEGDQGPGAAVLRREIGRAHV